MLLVYSTPCKETQSCEKDMKRILLTMTALAVGFLSIQTGPSEVLRRVATHARAMQAYNQGAFQGAGPAAFHPSEVTALPEQRVEGGVFEHLVRAVEDDHTQVAEAAVVEYVPAAEVPLNAVRPTVGGE